MFEESYKKQKTSLSIALFITFSNYVLSFFRVNPFES